MLINLNKIMRLLLFFLEMQRCGKNIIMCLLMFCDPGTDITRISFIIIRWDRKSCTDSDKIALEKYHVLVLKITLQNLHGQPGIL